MHTEKTLDEKEIYKGRVITVVEQTVELENHNTSRREIVRHNGGAGIVAVDDQYNILMVRQYRKPFDMETLEIPAGKLEKGEDPYLCAIRELQEETGMIAEKVESLGHILSTPGFCSEKIYLYMATGLSAGTLNPDIDEFITCEKIPLKRCLNMVENGEINDAKTVVGLLRVARIFNY